MNYINIQQALKYFKCFFISPLYCKYIIFETWTRFFFDKFCTKVKILSDIEILHSRNIFMHSYICSICTCLLGNKGLKQEHMLHCCMNIEAVAIEDIEYIYINLHEYIGKNVCTYDTDIRGQGVQLRGGISPPLNVVIPYSNFCFKTFMFHYLGA